jgi:hypothetical protein
VAHRPALLEPTTLASLRAACELLLDSPFDLRSVSLVVVLPEIDGAGRPLLYSAERLAAENDLQVDVRLDHRTAEVTLRRPGTPAPPAANR